MSNRHLARTIVMQSLFEWDFKHQPTEELPEIVGHVKEEFAPEFDDAGYIEKQVEGVVSNIQEIDETLGRFAPEWPLQEMTSTDRNILRLGAYELMFDESIPSKVAINEAIELGKTFGGESSGKFINGVLGAVFRNREAEGKGKEIDQQKKNDEEEESSESETNV